MGVQRISDWIPEIKESDLVNLDNGKTQTLIPTPIVWP